jgi:hypothetical protein
LVEKVVQIMTLPSSGPISIQSIATEFSRVLSVPLESYYAGAGIVTNPTSNATGVSVPTSGAISIFNFYGVSAFTPFSNTITATGLTTITIPAGATTALIEVWGGGAGGGQGTGTGCTAKSGGGGGSGAYSKLSVSVAGHAGQTIKCNVGIAGAASAAGGQSNVQSGTFTTTTQIANGGNPGASGTTGTGGTGGTASGGSTNTTGNTGGAGGPNSPGGASVAAPTGTNGPTASSGNSGHGSIQASLAPGAGVSGEIVIAWS